MSDYTNMISQISTVLRSSIAKLSPFTIQTRYNFSGLSFSFYVMASSNNSGNEPFLSQVEKVKDKIHVSPFSPTIT